MNRQQCRDELVKSCRDIILCMTQREGSNDPDDITALEDYKIEFESAMEHIEDHNVKGYCSKCVSEVALQVPQPVSEVVSHDVAIEARLKALEDKMKAQAVINGNVLEMLNRHDEQISNIGQDVRSGFNNVITQIGVLKDVIIAPRIRRAPQGHRGICKKGAEEYICDGIECDKHRRCDVCNVRLGKSSYNKHVGTKKHQQLLLLQGNNQ